MKYRSLVLITLIALFAGVANASTQTVLWNFGQTNTDGSSPWSNFLISDHKGNLYGVTSSGGTNSTGMVFELSPNGSGGYNETILYDFGAQNSGDGSTPYGSLVFDKTGKLYGTTQGGGNQGNGTVYRLSRKAGGGWKETVLYKFDPSGVNGSLPSNGVAIGKDGSLYGTTANGGTNSFGVAYKLTKTKKGWTQTVLHNFGATGDGSFPYDGVMLDAAGNVYGATASGGTGGGGTIYRLSFTPKRGWIEDVLYNFTGMNGDGSGMYYVSLTSDKVGNIYGATAFGGTNNNGTVWELVYSKTKKTYREKVLYSFGATGSGDGYYPYGGVIWGKDGSLYGTTENGGSSNPNGGTVYKVTKSGKTWTESVVYSFTAGADGQNPSANLFKDAKGNLFGMAEFGGSSNHGVVYQVTP